MIEQPDWVPCPNCGCHRKCKRRPGDEMNVRLLDCDPRKSSLRPGPSVRRYPSKVAVGNVMEQMAS